MSTDDVSVIDISPFLLGGSEDKKRVAAEVGHACETIGFVNIQGHGVPEQLIERVRGVAYEFFALAVEEKLKIGRPAPEITRGYDTLANQSLSASLGNPSPPDLQETFGMGPVDVPDDPYHTEGMARVYFAPNLWPARPAEMRAVFEDYYRRLRALGSQIMRIFALALNLREDFFDDKIADSISHIRFNKYPAQIEPPLPGQLRAGAHTDYGSLTILYGEDTPGGLQVVNRKGEWTDIHPAPGSFVLNLGDLMARWTNDRWVSTLHRVVNPPRQFADRERLSIAFFHAPNYDAEIKCVDTCQGPSNPPKFEALIYGEYRLDKTLKTRLSEPAV
ncbi:MAG TPA: 2-oxoglutarate and iron-dependent oxygenase domain-containing protein [Rhodospirillales bacterium]|nr:2-oxoglutarate and iron-dependent oxygenase domain-containing protein [Rhodospirillales bacterium]